MMFAPPNNFLLPVFFDQHQRIRMSSKTCQSLEVFRNPWKSLEIQLNFNRYLWENPQKSLCQNSPNTSQFRTQKSPEIPKRNPKKKKKLIKKELHRKSSKKPQALMDLCQGNQQWCRWCLWDSSCERASREALWDGDEWAPFFFFFSFSCGLCWFFHEFLESFTVF